MANRVFLIGRLTRDPELGATASNIPYCRFSIAVNRNYPNANGEREADFFNIVTWRGQAENCHKYLFKGNKVAVSGSIGFRSYEKDGEKRTSAEVNADEVEFLSPKSEQETTQTETQNKSQTQPRRPMRESTPVDMDEDLPF